MTALGNVVVRPGLLRLLQPFPVSGRVRVVVESSETQPALNFEKFLEGLKTRQAERGHQPMTREHWPTGATHSPAVV